MHCAKSNLIVRSLIFNASKFKSFENMEKPVLGEQSGDSACLSTTGEVNLYLDPDTFGTEVPHFWADCEGLLGSEPAAAKYQKEWSKQGRSYLLESNNGKQIDRKTAVTTIYPRFLYLSSDVICMVTKNARAWADAVLKLLEWSQIGAHNTINKSSLPALIIVLNGPEIEDETWISDDHDALTKEFFKAIENQIVENTTLRNMAKKVSKQLSRAVLVHHSYAYLHKGQH